MDKVVNYYFNLYRILRGKKVELKVHKCVGKRTGGGGGELYHGDLGHVVNLIMSKLSLENISYLNAISIDIYLEFLYYNENKNLFR